MSTARLPAVDDELPLLAALLAFEALAVAGYYLLVPGEVESLRYVIYPFVWINIGLLAVAHTDPPTGGPRRLAAVVSSAYFLLLAYLTGLIGLYVGGHGSHSHDHIQGWSVSMTAPGWGPRIAYMNPDVFHVSFVPYRVIGFLALSYLLYVAIREVTASVTSSVVGVVSCLGCSFPLVTAAAAAAGGAGFASLVSTYSVDLSTLLFVSAVGLLMWRPGLTS